MDIQRFASRSGSVGQWWITDNLALGETKNLIPGILSLNHIRNTGAAWSMLEGKMWFFTIVTLIAVVVILTLMIKNREKVIAGS